MVAVQALCALRMVGLEMSFASFAKVNGLDLP